MNLTKILEEAKKLKIAVIGDFIIDKYVIGTANRLSPEAPVVVLLKKDSFFAHGGAGNVWANLKNLGVDAHLFCDGTEKMQKQNRDDMHIQLGPVSIKTRLMAGSHHLLRIDQEPSPDEIVWPIFKDVTWSHKFIEMLPTFDCVVISDYRKGVVSKSVGEMVVALCNDYKKPVVVDAKDEFGRFGGATILKCNQHEMKKSGFTMEELKQMVHNVVVTFGDDGIKLYSETQNYHAQGHDITVSDVSGAGDTVTAILAIMMGIEKEPLGRSVKEACYLANIAASEVVQHAGVHPISEEELIRRFNQVFTTTTNG